MRDKNRKKEGNGKFQGIKSHEKNQEQSLKNSITRQT